MAFFLTAGNINTVKVKPTELLIVAIIALFFQTTSYAEGKTLYKDISIPILVYHRFGPAVLDSMTVTVPVFESHLKYLRDNGFTVIPLKRYVEYLLGKAPPPHKSVIITADDGHLSVYKEMLPLVKKYCVPVTLFVYPTAISNAEYAMTWDQLKELKETGLFEVQSHSYWHPDFRKEKKRLSHEDYQRFVDMQLTGSKEKLETELGGKVDMLAWPFGIYDDELIDRALKAGYIAAFTVERRHAGPSDRIMAIPRYLMTNGIRGKTFWRLLAVR